MANGKRLSNLEKNLSCHVARDGCNLKNRPFRPNDAIAICIIAAMLGIGGCIAPTYNIYVGGEHKHGEKHVTGMDQKTDGTDSTGLDDSRGTVGLFRPASRRDNGVDSR